MKNSILLRRGWKVTKNTLGLILFLFTLISVANVATAQNCSLVAEDEISAAVDENCEAIVTVDAVLDGTMTSCPAGQLFIYLYDDQGGLVASSPVAGDPAVIPAGYTGQTLTAIVEDNVSGNQSNDCLVNVFDNIDPTMECWQNLENTLGVLGFAAPTYNRVADGSDDVTCSAAGFGFNDVRYDVLAFEVDASDTYEFTFNGNAFPGGGFFVALYGGGFNPAAACDDLITTDFGTDIVVSGALVPGTTYYLVTSMYSNFQVGAYQYYFTSNALGMVQVAVPDCNYDLYCYNDLDNSVVIRVADNCDSNASVALVDEVTNENDCISGWDEDIFRIIDRTYRATDASNNESDDLDVTVTIRKMPDFQFQQSVVEPDDLLVTTDNAIECDETYPLNIYGNPDPSYAGAPTLEINGQVISLETPYMACNITAAYIDLPYTQNNDCIKQFARMWTVTEWSCQNPNNVVFPPFLQVIEIADTTDPLITCPDDEVINTNTQGVFDNTTHGTVYCGAEYTFPVPYAVDNCQSDLTWDINILNDTDQSIVFLNDVSLTSSATYDLPLGVNTLIYRVYDGCNNYSECEFTVEVQDWTPPVAICQTFTTVALTYDGEAEVPATSFDSGSWDDCQMGDIKVRRMDADPDEYFDYVTFDCSDIGDPDLMVVMRVYDIFENWSECMVAVEVQDKLNPIIECPDDMEVACDFFYEANDLAAYFGWPTAYDNCSVVVTTDSIFAIDQCGEGTITRYFTATDPDGRTAQCEQTITFVNNHHFGCGTSNVYDPNNHNGDIVWPDDVTDIEGCIDPNNFATDSPLHPNQSGFPVLNEDQCDLAGPAIWTDEVYVANDNELDSPGACFKVIRTWKVTDWCNRVNGVFATWTHDQILMVNNYVAPDFSRILPDTTVCTFDETCSTGYIGLSLTATDGDGCTEDEDLKWQYKIDYHNDGGVNEYDYESPVYNGNALDASNYYAIGTHRILWTVWDQCGNSTAQEHLFTIMNCKKPTPICVQGLGTDLTNMGGIIQVMVGADFFDPANESSHSCGYPIVYSFSADTTDKVRTYFCADTAGLVDIEMWVTAVLPDGNITQDYCETTLDVQDNFELCPDGGLPMAMVSGAITDENDNAVSGVNIALEGSEFADQLSDEEGGFAFPEMITGGNYNVKPQLNDNHSNGVSTLDLIHVQKHLLGLRAIDSPYKMIAADINNDHKVSASDLLDARELILGVNDEFANNTSWRFIRKDYQFENEANPLTESLPEVEPIENIQEDVYSEFIAIKIGDITNDASLNGLPVVEGRSNLTLNLDIDNTTFETGNVEVPIYAKDFDQINGFQFTLNFDPSAMRFDGIKAGVLNINSSNYFDTHTGNVNVSWSRAIALDVADEAVLFTLSFNAKKKAALNEVLFISSDLTKAEAYNSGLDKMEVALNFRNLEMDAEYALYQNTPNPFSDNTVIKFNMQKAGLANITIYDMNGRVLKVIEDNFDKGVHEVSISKYDLPVNGMLYYQMNTEGFTATKKMILVK